jgi:hypothetical protein
MVGDDQRLDRLTRITAARCDGLSLLSRRRHEALWKGVSFPANMFSVARAAQGIGKRLPKKGKMFPPPP